VSAEALVEVLVAPFHRKMQVELAQQVGVSRQTVITMETGDYAPSVYLALRVARVLGTTVEALWG